MTSRERVLAALQHERTDRVPRLLYEEAIGYVPAIEKLLGERCAPKTPREFFDMDITGVAAASTVLPRSRFAEWLGPESEEALRRGEVDEWGVRWRGGSLHHFAHIESPLRGVEDPERLRRYPWPDLDQEYRWRDLAGRVAELQAHGVAVAAFAGSVFEQAWYLRGMDDLMADMLTRAGIAHEFLDRLAFFQRLSAQRFARAGVDILITGDDVAGQRGLLMKAETWRTFLKPRLAATAKAVKAINPECRIFYHSDGNIEALIPDLIEAGVDILNPIQPECMDPSAVKRKYGAQLSFWGAVSVQRTMPFGTPEDVRREVRRRIAEMGGGGGYILAPAHVLSPEVPWENIVAFFEAADTPPPA